MRLGYSGLAMEVKRALRLEKGTQTKESQMERLGPTDMFVQMRVIEADVCSGDGRGLQRRWLACYGNGVDLEEFVCYGGLRWAGLRGLLDGSMESLAVGCKRTV
jgi:hypothetical protein